MDSKALPVFLPVNAANIPRELRDRPQWLVWKLMTRNGKPSKVPFNARTRRFGKSNDPATWSDFGTAINVYREGGYHGVGFAFAVDDGICGIDLDHVFDPATGEIEPWALEIVERFKHTYVEWSPSGQGIRIFCRGRPIRCGKGTYEKRIEIYNYTSPRYLTVTGVVFDFTGNSMENDVAPMGNSMENDVAPMGNSMENDVAPMGNSMENDVATTLESMEPSHA
jgi:primase-polymerase (primpol)-like protein